MNLKRLNKLIKELDLTDPKLSGYYKTKRVELIKKINQNLETKTQILVTSKDFKIMTDIQLVTCIKDLKSMLKKAKLENQQRDYLQLKEDSEYYYEIDLDNCNMKNIDWIKEIALLMTKKDYDKEILSELNLYINTRKEN